jgi:hypothetical protein
VARTCDPTKWDVLEFASKIPYIIERMELLSLGSDCFSFRGFSSDPVHARQIPYVEYPQSFTIFYILDTVELHPDVEGFELIKEYSKKTIACKVLAQRE